MQNVTNTTRAFLCAATRCDAQLFAFGALLAFPVLRAILLILAIRAVELSIAYVLLTHANVCVRHILVCWTRELADLTLNWTLAFVVASFAAIHKPIA